MNKVKVLPFSSSHVTSTKTLHLAEPHLSHLQSGANYIKLSPQERLDYFLLKLE